MCHQGAYNLPVQLGTSLSGAKHLIPTAWPSGTCSAVDGEAQPLGDAGPLGAASGSCSGTSLIRAVGCIISPGTFTVRG